MKNAGASSYNFALRLPPESVVSSAKEQEQDTAALAQISQPPDRVTCTLTRHLGSLGDHLPDRHPVARGRAAAEHCAPACSYQV